MCLHFLKAGSENEKLTCGVQYGVSGIPGAGEFSSVSDTVWPKNMTHHDGISCSFDEFLRFETFFSNFTPIAREVFLPPEKLRFGLVPERALLSSLGVEDSGSWLSSLHVRQSDSWLIILHFVGCPSCSKVLREGDDLKSALLMQNSLVREVSYVSHFVFIQFLFELKQVMVLIPISVRCFRKFDIRIDIVKLLTMLCMTQET